MSRLLSIVLVAGAALSWARCVAAGLLPPMNGNPSDFQERRAGAEVNAAARIGITQDGLYRIAYSNFLAAGITNPVGSEIRLFCQTQEVALYISTVGAMGTDDFALFYGYAHNGYYSSTNVYWLGAGGTGLRMATQNAATNATAASLTSCWQTIWSASNALYRPADFPEDEQFDHWFADYITAAHSSRVAIATPARIPGLPASFELRVRGLSTNSHNTQLYLNSSFITNLAYGAAGAGRGVFTARCIFGSAFLADGFSTVTLVHTGSTDVADWESMAIRYPRMLRVFQDQLLFEGTPGTNNYLVSGFATNTSMWLLNVAGTPALLTNFAIYATPTSGYGVVFSASAVGTALFYVCESAAIRPVPAPEPVQLRGLADTNRQADFILICPYEFRSSAYRLLKHRQVSGLRSVVAPVSDIYNEFAYGIKDADAIKQFIGYAFHHWSKPEPKYALLVGEGTYDPQNWLGLAGACDWVPAHLGPTPEQWTALDNWFVTVNGTDFLPDLVLGRIAVATDAELGMVVNKILAYEGATGSPPWKSRATLVADKVSSGINFASSSETYINAPLITNGFTVYKAYHDSMSASAIRTQMSNDLNSGRFLQTYFGHGAMDRWSADNLWNNNDIVGLRNTNLPIMANFTCKIGEFHDPTKECMAEVFVEKATNGAVASFAPSALSENSDAEHIADGFIIGLISNRLTRLGLAKDAGLLDLWNYYPFAPELLAYEILGDPALLVNRP